MTPNPEISSRLTRLAGIAGALGERLVTSMTVMVMASRCAPRARTRDPSIVMRRPCTRISLSLCVRACVCVFTLGIGNQDNSIITVPFRVIAIAAGVDLCRNSGTR